MKAKNYMPASGIAGDWVNSAEEDLSAIRAILAAKDPPWRIVSYHAHQAGEKFLKAFLLQKGWRLRKIHDLVELLADAQTFDPALASLQKDCLGLNAFVQAGRYPMQPVTESESRDAVAAAGRIRTGILKRLT